jgi:prepilin-type N-terminal cleavage/methylation domain-containing protein
VHTAESHDAGFTLLELMVVVLVIGVLVLVAVASYVPSTQRAAAVACEHNRAALERALDAHAAGAMGSLPATTTLEVLQPYVKNFDGATTCPSDGSPYALDLASRTISCPNHP